MWYEKRQEQIDYHQQLHVQYTHAYLYKHICTWNASISSIQVIGFSEITQEQVAQ